MIGDDTGKPHDRPLLRALCGLDHVIDPAALLPIKVVPVVLRVAGPAAWDDMEQDRRAEAWQRRKRETLSSRVRK